MTATVGLGLAVGDTGTPYEMPIERGKIREFARATKAVDPIYDTADPPVPPTFLITSCWWTRPGSSVLEQSGREWSRLLSGGAEFRVVGPALHCGEVLTARQRVTEIYERSGRRGGRMTFLVFTTEFRRRDGSLAAEERHTTIVTDGPPAPPPLALADAPGPGPAPVRPRTCELAAAGDVLPSFVDRPLSRTDIVAYQGASGDLNPIHHDDDHARAAGFAGAFSVGMLHAGILASYLGDLFGAAQITAFAVQFREVAWPGDVLTYGGTASSVSADAIGLELSVYRQTGGKHLRGWATVRR